MNFGNTLEEQYAKISLINKKISKFSKVFSLFFLIGAAFLILFSFASSENRGTFLALAVFMGPLGFFFGKYFMGRLYGWAWVAFCEKYNPKSLAISFSDATYNSAVEGYVFGGQSGAKSASIGVLIVAAFLINFFIWKGGIYMIKYWNLPKKEQELKKQLEAKYGKTL